METVTSLISSVGFPIVCCGVMFVQNGKLQSTLHDITLTMQKLVDKIECIEKNN